MKFKTISAVTLIALGISGATFAHEGAMGIVKERMDAMSTISKNMKSISAMLTGKAKYEGGVVAKQAEEISHHASKIPHHFKEEKEDKFTEASPAIWEKPDIFKKYAKELSAYADLLAQKATLTSDRKLLKADFKKLAGTCKTCHQAFRIKK